MRMTRYGFDSISDALQAPWRDPRPPAVGAILLGRIAPMTPHVCRRKAKEDRAKAPKNVSDNPFRPAGYTPSGGEATLDPQGTAAGAERRKSLGKPASRS
jgi:hypothetical protein